VSDFFRPNVWPNTPDILHAQLQEKDPVRRRAVFQLRAVLAAICLRRYASRPGRLETMREMVAYLVFAVFLVPAFAADCSRLRSGTSALTSSQSRTKDGLCCPWWEN